MKPSQRVLDVLILLIGASFLADLAARILVKGYTGDQWSGPALLAVLGGIWGVRQLRKNGANGGGAQ